MNRLATIAAAATLLAAGIASAAPVLNAANGHYYEYIDTYVTFDEAIAGAAAKTYMGWQGYLVTVTDAQESDFIYSSVTSSTVYAGGTDREVEGTWKWITGPEAGTVFWKDGVTQTYARWNAGEPNNCCGGENALLLNWSGANWNDIAENSRYQYVVEYSVPVPEPASYALMLLGLAGIGAIARRRA